MSIQSTKAALQAHEQTPIGKFFSTAEFDRAVREVAPKIAVFDCDGTLWSGDAGSSFMAWSIEAGLLPRVTIEWLAERYALYNRGELSEVGICGEMVQVYAGLPEARMREAAETFFAERIEPLLFPEMQQIVAELQRAGCEIWAVSSTNHWVIEAGVQRFHLPPARVLAARVAVENGIVSNHLLDVPTDEGKVAALARHGVLKPDAVFGNSIHDAAMLAIARQAFPVNPTKALVERSVSQGWPVYFPSSVRAQ